MNSSLQEKIQHRYKIEELTDDGEIDPGVLNDPPPLSDPNALKLSLRSLKLESHDLDNLGDGSENVQTVHISPQALSNDVDADRVKSALFNPAGHKVQVDKVTRPKVNSTDPRTIEVHLEGIHERVVLDGTIRSNSQNNDEPLSSVKSGFIPQPQDKSLTFEKSRDAVLKKGDFAYGARGYHEINAEQLQEVVPMHNPLLQKDEALIPSFNKRRKSQNHSNQPLPGRQIHSKQKRSVDNNSFPAARDQVPFQDAEFEDEVLYKQFRAGKIPEFQVQRNVPSHDHDAGMAPPFEEQNQGVETFEKANNADAKRIENLRKVQQIIKYRRNNYLQGDKPHTQNPKTGHSKHRHDPNDLLFVDTDPHYNPIKKVSPKHQNSVNSHRPTKVPTSSHLESHKSNKKDKKTHKGVNTKVSNSQKKVSNFIETNIEHKTDEEWQPEDDWSTEHLLPTQKKKAKAKPRKGF